MNTSGALISTPGSAEPSEARVRMAEIDASCRKLLLLLFPSALIWLTLAVTGLLICFIKLHSPGFLGQTAWLTFGRLQPGAMNAFLYGFATQTALGIMLWMTCRLGSTRLVLPAVALAGAVVWNIGVTIGLIGILAGLSTGFEWLEIPGDAALILLVAYVLIGASTGVSFHFRRERELYVSQWFILAALFWFPWIYSAANLLLIFHPARGAVQAIVNAWFTNNFLGLWLTPVALGAIFYFIPKLLERPLYSRSLAVFGFWTLALFTPWTGLVSLAGGPVPAWMASVSIAAQVLMVVPLLAAMVNWHKTLEGNYGKIRTQPTLQYIALGALAYVISTLAGIVLASRSASHIAHFTFLDDGQRQLGLWGFVGMTYLGAMAFILPRLLQTEWPAKTLRVHLGLSASGVTLICAALALGGWVQAIRLPDPLTPFVEITRSTVPFIGVATAGWLLLLVGQIILLAALHCMLRRYTASYRQATGEVLTGLPQAPEGRP